MTVDQGGLKTDTGYSRYPVWNYCKSVDVKLVEELMFETDMRVSLRPAKESNIQEIGSFVVPVHSIARYPHRNSKRPQFFHLLNEEGQFVGSILCNFYVKLYPKMTQKEKKAGKQNLEHIALEEEFRSIFDDHFQVNIDVALLGLRNLVTEAEEPQVTVRLTGNTINDSEQPKPVEMDK